MEIAAVVIELAIHHPRTERLLVYLVLTVQADRIGRETGNPIDMANRRCNVSNEKIPLVAKPGMKFMLNIPNLRPSAGIEGNLIGDVQEDLLQRDLSPWTST